MDEGAERAAQSKGPGRKSNAAGEPKPGERKLESIEDEEAWRVHTLSVEGLELRKIQGMVFGVPTST